MTSAPVFSVLMRTTGRGSDLAQALASVVAQTADRATFEVVVINDGGPSVAESVAVVADVVAVQLIELTDHVGKSEAINEGFRRSRGRYLCILDDDDAYFPDHLAVLLGQVTDGPDTAILYTDTEIVLRTDTGRPEVIGTNCWEYSQAELFMMRGAPIACSICIRRDAWSLVDGFDPGLTRVLDDWDFYMRLSRHFEFVHVPVITSQYTQPPPDRALLRFPSFEAGLRRMSEKLRGFTVPLDAALALDVALDKLRFDQSRAAADITLGNVRAFAGSTPQDEPLEQPRAAMKVLDPVHRASMSTLTMAVFTVEVANVGGGAWSSGGGRHPVHLSYHWLGEDGEVDTWDGLRTPLPFDLAPGQSSEARLLVLAPRRPGRYRWAPAVVQEGIGWISQPSGSPEPQTVSVRVAE